MRKNNLLLQPAKAKRHLEERAVDLLSKAHEKAQYEVCQASLFPFAWPSRSFRSGTTSRGSGTRPRSNSPPPLETDRLQFERKINVEGHRDGFRTVIRRCLRNGLGVDQRRAQEWAEIADYFVDWAVIKGTFKAIESRNGVAVGVAAMAAAVDARGVYRYVKYDPSIVRDAFMGKVKDFLKAKLRGSLKWE
jgi:hypothetical protein